MGEYVKYKGQEIKIGTLESLYYVSYDKYQKAFANNQLSKLPNNSPPSEYLKPEAGFRFRFPFPDEDHLPFGDIGQHDYCRMEPVLVRGRIDEAENTAQDTNSIGLINVEIAQQKLIHREADGKLTLAVLLREPVEDKLFRIEDEATANALCREIIRNQVINESNPQKRNFYRQIAKRILSGYRLETPARRNIQKKQNAPRQKRRGKGLR